MASVVFCLSWLPVPQWAILLIQLAAGAAVTVFTYEKVYRNEEYQDVKNALLKLMKLN